MKNQIIINLEKLYTEQAKLLEADSYEKQALDLAGVGNIVVLTGRAPIWMYLKIAHALHGKAKKLLYSAPGQGINEFEIFNHDPH